MDVIFTHCAGLDVHKKTVMACRITPDPTGQQAEGLVELKEFGTMSVDLLALSDWLLEAGITHVAMESTGEYWKPVFNLLEGNVQVVLVNAAHVQAGAGAQDRQSRCALVGQAYALWLVAGQFHPLCRPTGAARSDPVPHQVGAGAQPGSQPRARGVGAGEHQARSGGQRYYGGVGPGNPGGPDRGPHRSCDHGGVGERPLAQQDPAPGAGVDRAGAGSSSAYAGHPVGAYRLSGRADRGPERGDHPVPDGPECEQRLAHGERCRWCRPSRGRPTPARTCP